VSETKRVRIFVAGTFAGVLSKEGDDYSFAYAPSYAALGRRGHPVSLLLPIREEPYVSRGRPHPYFQGIMHEGWLRRLAETAEQQDETRGFLHYLVHRCRDSVGDVEIIADTETQPRFVAPLVVVPSTGGAPVYAHKQCLYCCRELSSPGHNRNYHHECAQKIFGLPAPPLFDIAPEDFERLAHSSVSSGIAIPGVQPKLAVYLKGADAHFIIKPQVAQVKAVPETESLWMALAGKLGIPTAKAGLVEIRDGSLVYITRRFDRGTGGQKLHAEDFAQLLGKSTLGDEKFEGGIRDIARVIKKYCIRPELSLQRLWDLVIFNYLFGNSDAHLKNYSLIGLPVNSVDTVYALSPAYDLLPTRFMSESGSFSALEINGKRSNLTRADFRREIEACGMDDNVADRFLELVRRKAPEGIDFMKNSHVPPGKIRVYLELIEDRFKAIGFGKRP
jgi:serine/threonine-protein kinase HipA